MAKKLTKIDQQRIDFLNNIDFSDWKKVKDNIHDIHSWEYSKTFAQYHDVMFDYYNIKNNEIFVKKWWFRVRHPNLQANVPLIVNIITRQRATFAVNYDDAAIRIINDVKDNMYTSFSSIKK